MIETVEIATIPIAPKQLDKLRNVVLGEGYDVLEYVMQELQKGLGEASLDIDSTNEMRQRYAGQNLMLRIFMGIKEDVEDGCKALAQDVVPK